MKISIAKRHLFSILLHCNKLEDEVVIIHERIDQGVFMKNYIESVSLVALVSVYVGVVIYLYTQKAALFLSISYSMSSIKF